MRLRLFNFSMHLKIMSFLLPTVISGTFGHPEVWLSKSKTNNPPNPPSPAYNWGPPIYSGSSSTNLLSVGVLLGLVQDPLLFCLYTLPKWILHIPRTLNIRYLNDYHLRVTGSQIYFCSPDHSFSLWRPLYSTSLFSVTHVYLVPLI